MSFVLKISHKFRSVFLSTVSWLRDTPPIQKTGPTPGEFVNQRNDHPSWSKRWPTAKSEPKVMFLFNWHFLAILKLVGVPMFPMAEKSPKLRFCKRQT